MNSFEKIITTLAEHEVRYLIVGGVAVVLHGVLRTTADLDLVCELTEQNTKRAIIALESLGYRPRPPVPFAEFSNPKKRKEWIEQKGLTVFSLWNQDPTLPEIDLFVEVPFPFQKAYKNRVNVPLGKSHASVVSLKQLIDMKQQVARAQDLADIERLSKIT